MPNSKKDYDGIEPCAVGSTVEVLVSNAHCIHSIYYPLCLVEVMDRTLICCI